MLLNWKYINTAGDLICSKRKVEGRLDLIRRPRHLDNCKIAYWCPFLTYSLDVGSWIYFLLSDWKLISFFFRRQVMQVKALNMATNAQCVLSGESFCAVTHAHWPTISNVLIHLSDEYRAGTGPVRCALGLMKKDLAAVAWKRPL